MHRVTAEVMRALYERGRIRAIGVSKQGDKVFVVTDLGYRVADAIQLSAS
jgi:hypothetical protein